MFFMPLPFLLSWLFSLVSLAVLGGGLYLLGAWYVGAVVGTAYLAASLVMVLWSFCGRWVVLQIFRRPGPDEPGDIQPESTRRLERPDGTELHVEVHGRSDAPPIVFCHGAGTNRSSWYYAVRQLADRFKVITWDLPGLGLSSGPPTDDFSLERHARDLDAVLSAVCDQPATLVGHSLGGMIVLTYARLFPERLGHAVSGVVLVDTSPTNPVRTTTGGGLFGALQKPLLEPLLHLVIWFSPLVRLMDWLGYFNGSSHVLTMLTGFAGSETRGQLDLATRYNPLASPAVRARENLAMLRYDATDVLNRLPVPALVATGHLDRMIIPETARQMASAIPDSTLVELRPAGHMSIFEQHAELFETLARFASGVAGGVR